MSLDANVLAAKLSGTQILKPVLMISVILLLTDCLYEFYSG